MTPVNSGLRASGNRKRSFSLEFNAHPFIIWQRREKSKLSPHDDKRAAYSVRGSHAVAGVAQW
jgi:hypothetical protein